MAKVAAEVGSTANQYQILAKLAVGGMAEIFLARGASVAGVERYCVLKRILRDRASDALLVQMFVDEARLAAQLQHPNIASVYDIGMLGDSYFFTMEYVHGETIRALLQRAQQLQRSIPLACVLTIIAGAAAGLQHAHERNSNEGRPLGIVHRDVSPSNLMVSFEGHVKVVDFGVAKAADRAVETKSGTVKGKISYLSPEQCRGARVDRRSDLFSLGIVMWEMLTGARLYRRSSDFENMTAIVSEPPPPPSSRRPEVPPAVDDIVLKLLAKSASARFQTAAEVIDAIEHASLRAGTMLSSSAVSRLVRDLFGTRREPWLVRDAPPHEAVTLASRPVPAQVGPARLDAVEAELAAVPDLSAAAAVTDEDPEVVPITVSSSAELLPSLDTTAELPRGLVTLPDPPRATAVDLPSGPLTMPGPAVAVTVALSPRALVTAAAAPDPAVPFARPSAPTLLAGSAPPPAPAVGPYASTLRIGGAALDAALAAASRRSGSRPASSTAALAGARRRVPWALLAVIAGAAALGIVLAWLFARTGPADPPAEKIVMPSTAALPDAALPDAALPDAALPDAVLLDAAPLAPPAIVVDPPVPGPAPRRPEPAAEPKSVERRPPVVKPGRPPSDKTVLALYGDEQYREAVAACRGASPAVAALCVMAACREHERAVATSWLAKVPEKNRASLNANCQQYGGMDLRVQPYATDRND